MDQYSLPYYQEAKHKWYTKILDVFLLAFFGAGFVFSVVVVMKENIIAGLLCSIVDLFLLVLFGYMFKSIILKQFFIELTNEHIRVRDLFTNHTVSWEEISEVNTYSYRGYNYISILLKKDILKKNRRNIGSSLMSLFNIPTGSFQISGFTFDLIDIERLFFTITEQVEKNKVDNNLDLTKSDIERRNENKFPVAFVLSMMVSIILGIIYGFSIYKLNENYVIIPIFGSLFRVCRANRVNGII